MDYLQQKFSVRFEYPIFFTENLFNPENLILRNFFAGADNKVQKKVFFVVDDGVIAAHPSLPGDITSYFNGLAGSLSLVDEIMQVPGGEHSKNSEDQFYKIIAAIDRHGIDRHSYLAAIGGGSVLDLVGYAAAVAHRGIRHVRIPTTVLSQNDSGVGVKNGINYFNKKNFLGTFSPPVGVFNDYHFLTTLSLGEWTSGMSEAVKVALIKDKIFFEWLEQHAAALANRDKTSMQYLIKRCAALHTEHIGGGDPFEMGSSRPLDFGHWSAHKIEPLSGFSVRHGEAVAMGIALDSAYSCFSGRISQQDAGRIIALLKSLGFAITHPLMEIHDDSSPVLQGLNEFREHLGGELTIMLLNSIGKGEEVHALDHSILQTASRWLKQIA